jgi:hypothetical protein
MSAFARGAVLAILRQHGLSKLETAAPLSTKTIGERSAPSCPAAPTISTSFRSKIWRMCLT